MPEEAKYCDSYVPRNYKLNFCQTALYSVVEGKPHPTLYANVWCHGMALLGEDIEPTK